VQPRSTAPRSASLKPPAIAYVGEAFQPRRHLAATFGVITVILACLLLLACSSSGAGSEPEPTEDTGPRLTLVNRAGKQVSLSLEVALTPEQRQTGLSGRESLPKDAGMLFIFERRSAGFWMKDTLITLSVAFIANCGEIVHIAHMEPLSLQVHNAPGEYHFGLEVNRGWFEDHVIAVGDRVVVPEAYRVAGCT
jgi:uncharacterized protein